MAVNLTPQYLDAEAEYKKAQTAEDRLACLRKMWTLLPKHKASEKLQAELKTKISDTAAEVENDRRHPKKSGLSHKIPRQGAGQVLLVGAPNGGKSRILSRLSKATPEVAPYPFTTREPSAGMMAWEDARVQLIDTPPISPEHMEAYLSSMVRSADLCVLVVDLGDDDGPFGAEAALERLAQTKTLLVGEPPAEVEDPTVAHIKTILAANKVDAEGAGDRLDIVKEMFALRFPIVTLDAESGDKLEDLRNAIWQALKVIRVYSKKPGKPADMDSPFTIPVGGTVHQMAEQVHREVADKLKSARVWGSSAAFEGQTVTRDHVLHDRDVVELHT